MLQPTVLEIDQTKEIETTMRKQILNQYNPVSVSFHKVHCHKNSFVICIMYLADATVKDDNLP